MATYKILSRSTTTPPGSPTQGDAYIIPGGSSAPWDTHIGQIAVKDVTDWIYTTPIAGDLLWIVDTSALLLYDGAAYNALAMAADVVGLLDFKGATNCSGNPNYPAASKGDFYVVSAAGKIGGASGTSVDVGDSYYATADNAGGTEAGVGANWAHVEHNLVGALLAANSLSDVASAIAAKDNISVHGSDIASAGTLNLGAATGDVVDVTGTTNITAITLADGKRRIVRFTGALTLTHGASLVLPGSANITTVAGDFAIFQGYAAGVVRCVGYFPIGAYPVNRGGTGQTTVITAIDAFHAKSSDIASAGTTDLATATGVEVDITGTTDITALGTLAAGVIRVCRFTGAGLTVTHNATSLIMPGECNFRTSPNDVLIFESLGSGNWQCIALPPPMEHMSRIDSDFTLTNVGTAQNLFPSGQTTFTLPVGLYEVEGWVGIDTMNAANGNAAFDLKGTGAGNFAKQNWGTIGVDAAPGSGGVTGGGAWSVGNAHGGVNAVSAQTNTGMGTIFKGTVEVSGAGTFIPAITLQTANAAVVRRGSYLKFILKGPTGTTKKGKVS